jgi:hypothetical protein
VTYTLSPSDVSGQMRRIYHAETPPPTEIHLGRKAYNAYERGLLSNVRFSAGGARRPHQEALVFKAAIVRPVGDGWTMRTA